MEKDPDGNDYIHDEKAAGEAKITDPLTKAITALLRSTAIAMRTGGITNLSVSGAEQFVVQLETGQVIEGTLK